MKKMNWYIKGPGDIDYEIWIVCRDGRVFSRVYYCRGESFGHLFERPMRVRSVQLEKSQYETLERMLADLKAPKEYARILDGEGCEMIAYDEQGRERVHICGHIEGIQYLEKIRDFVRGAENPIC